MRYQRRNTLIADAAYDVSWTRMDGRDFHSRLPAGHPLAGQDQFPLGASDEFPWLSRGASINLSSNVDTTKPLLLADNFRNLLIIQNISSAVSPDVAPTLFVNLDGPVNFNGVATIGFAFALAPGVGVVLDTRVPNNSIYVAYEGASGAPTINGVLTYGRTQNSPPLPPGAIATVQAAQAAYRDPRLSGAADRALGGSSGGGGAAVSRVPLRR